MFKVFCLIAAFESLNQAIDEGIVLASLGPSAKGGVLKCLKCCCCAAIFVLLQRKVFQQEIIAGIVLASLGPSAKGGVLKCLKCFV
jgi:hypothetical protein